MEPLRTRIDEDPDATSATHADRPPGPPSTIAVVALGAPSHGRVGAQAATALTVRQKRTDCHFGGPHVLPVAGDWIKPQVRS